MYEYVAPEASIEVVWTGGNHTDAPYRKFARCTVNGDHLAYLSNSTIEFSHMATIATKPNMYIISVDPCDDSILMRLKLLMGVEISYPDM